MGTSVYTNYLASIQALIGTLIDSVETLEKKVNTFRGKVQAGINVEDSQAKLLEDEAELAKTRTKIANL